METNSLVEYGARRVIIVVTAILCALLEIVDTTIVNVALNEMKGNLGVTLSEIGWVITAYAIGNVIIIPMTSWLSQQFGRRNYFAASVILFTICSFLCGNASTLWELVLFRFLQGVGGGALLVTSQTIITEVFPKEKRGMAQALYGMGVIIGPTLGPPLGGYLVEAHKWPSIFYINIPIGIVAAILALKFIKNPPYSGTKKKIGEVDWWGIIFLAAAVGSLQFVLERGQESDWFQDTTILVLTVTSVLSFYLFIWREMTCANPIVNLRVLKDGNLRIGTVLTFVLGFGLYGSTFIIPLYLQSSLGWSAFQAGLIMVPAALMTAFMMPIVGQLIQRGVKQQYIAATGFLLFFIYSIWGHNILTPDTGSEHFFWLLMFRGFALSMLFIPITTLSLSTLKGREIGEGASFTGMMRQLGGSFGIAIITTYMSHQNAMHRSDLIANINPTNVAFQERFNGFVARFMSAGMPSNMAQQTAYAAMDGSVMKQAIVLSYMDVFIAIGFVFLASIPFVLFAKSSKSKVDMSNVH